MSKKLINAIAEMHEEDAHKLTQELLEKGTKPTEVLDAWRKGMDAIGQRFEEGVYFLPELMLAGEMMAQIMELI